MNDSAPRAGPDGRRRFDPAEPGLLVKARDVLRNGLVLQTLLDLAARLGIGITPYTVFEERLDRQCDGTASVPALRLGALAPADATAVARISEGELTAAEVRRRLRLGMEGFGAWSGDELVACSWANLEQLDWDPCRRPLADDEAYLYGARTARHWRGRNLCPVMCSAFHRRLADRGVTRQLSVACTLNRPAIRLKRKLGARRRAAYVHLDLWGRWRANWRVRGPR